MFCRRLFCLLMFLVYVSFILNNMDTDQTRSGLIMVALIIKPNFKSTGIIQQIRHFRTEIKQHLQDEGLTIP